VPPPMPARHPDPILAPSTSLSTSPSEPGHTAVRVRRAPRGRLRAAPDARRTPTPKKRATPKRPSSPHRRRYLPHPSEPGHTAVRVRRATRSPACCPRCASNPDAEEARHRRAHPRPSGTESAATGIAGRRPYRPAVPQESVRRPMNLEENGPRVLDGRRKDTPRAAAGREGSSQEDGGPVGGRTSVLALRLAEKRAVGPPRP
jgi:hypothetical protein